MTMTGTKALATLTAVLFLCSLAHAFFPTTQTEFIRQKITPMPPVQRATRYLANEEAVVNSNASYALLFDL